MDEQDLIGYMYGLRIEVRYLKNFHCDLFLKETSTLAKSYGYASEEVLLTDLLKELIKEWWIY